MDLICFFDTETTGFLKGNDIKNPGQPHVVQLAAVLADLSGKVQQTLSYIVKPEGYEIPDAAANVHKITTERALKVGMSRDFVLQSFNNLIELSDLLVCHNFNYDWNVMLANAYRSKTYCNFKPYVCTMSDPNVIKYCALPPTQKMKNAGRFHHKTPNLTELHEKCMGKDFGNAHNAMADVKATMNCFYHLVKEHIIEIPASAKYTRFSKV